MYLSGTYLGLEPPYPLMTRAAPFVDSLEMVRRLGGHSFDSLEQMQGSLSLGTCTDPAAYKRTNCVKLLQNPKTQRGAR